MSMQSNIERGRSWIAGAAQKFNACFRALPGPARCAQRAQRNPCRPMMPSQGRRGRSIGRIVSRQ